MNTDELERLMREAIAFVRLGPLTKHEHQELDSLMTRAVNALPELPEMLAKVKRLEEALTFYAARENYNDEPLPNNMWKTAKAVFDGGKRARAALEQTP